MPSTGGPCPDCGEDTVPEDPRCAFCGADLIHPVDRPVLASSSTFAPAAEPVDAIGVADPRRQRSTGILFVTFGVVVLLLGVAGIFLLRQWALLFVAFGLAFLSVGKRKIREASAARISNQGP